MSLNFGEKRKLGGGLVVLILIAIPLWLELYEPGLALWNIILAVMIIGLIIGAITGQRYFLQRVGEIGEARFDTRNRSDLDG